MNSPRIVVMAGSSRREALSRKVAAACVAPLAAAGADVDLVELADHPAPLYNGDLEVESGLPEGIVSLQRRLAAADGLLVVNPEYNGSITPLLKNALDWCSRPNPADRARSGGAVYAGRAAAVVGTSPGALGGCVVEAPQPALPGPSRMARTSARAWSNTCSAWVGSKSLA